MKSTKNYTIKKKIVSVQITAISLRQVIKNFKLIDNKEELKLNDKLERDFCKPSSRLMAKIESHNNLILSQQNKRKTKQHSEKDEKLLLEYENRFKLLHQELSNQKFKFEIQNEELKLKNEEIDKYIVEIRKNKIYEDKYNQIKQKNNEKSIEIDNLILMKEKLFRGNNLIITYII